MDNAKRSVNSVPKTATSTPWMGNTLFGVLANLPSNEKAITRLSMWPRSNLSSLERRYGNPDAGRKTLSTSWARRAPVERHAE
jgi:hypothetical protein